MNGDLFGGKYTAEEVQRIMNINARPLSLLKPLNPMYKKSATEHAPTWKEKREVSNQTGTIMRLQLISDSISKQLEMSTFRVIGLGDNLFIVCALLD